MAIPTMKAFKFYRIDVTSTSKVTTPSLVKYVTINELEMFENDTTGPNLCIGSTATASGFYQAGTEAPKAIDGNPATFWESANSIVNWIRIEFATAKVVRQLRITSTSYPEEVPRNFHLDGSNDGVVWETVLIVIDWVTVNGPKTGVLDTNRLFSGTSKTSDGLASVAVEIYHWDTHEFVVSLTPDSSGAWSYREYAGTPRQYLVVHKGPTGYRPQADGPVSSYIVP